MSDLQTGNRIGITTYGRNEEGRFTLPGEYVDAVRRAGGQAWLLAPGETDSADCLAGLDGIVLTGGGDLAPSLYGGVGVGETYGVDHERDQSELALAVAVLAASLPSLWICRGLQLLNVCLGGTLIEHLPEGVDGALFHRKPPRETTLHSVLVEPNSRLAMTLGCTSLETVSWHHQAVDILGTELEVVGRAPDGVIEALEHPAHPELTAVQWHPELSAADDPVNQRLFDSLVARARAQP